MNLADIFILSIFCTCALACMYAYARRENKIAGEEPAKLGLSIYLLKAHIQEQGVFSESRHRCPRLLGVYSDYDDALYALKRHWSFHPNVNDNSVTMEEVEQGVFKDRKGNWLVIETRPVLRR